MTSTNKDTILDLLIIGAGPVGLTAALEAKRLGLSVRIVDRKTERKKRDSRAVVVHPRVLELLEPIQGGNLTAEIVKNSFVLSGMFAYVPKWFHKIGFGDWMTGCWGKTDAVVVDTAAGDTIKPPKDDGSLSPVKLDLTQVLWGDTDYTNLQFLPQYETERILEEALVAEGGKVEYGIALEDLNQHDGVVTTTLLNDQTTESVNSRWVLGADGGRSKTRELIGVTLDRRSYDMFWVIADIVLKGDNIPLSSHAPGKGGHIFPSGPIAMLPLPGENAYRLAGAAPVGIKTADDVELNEQFFVDFLKERTGKTFEIELGEWQTIFEITHGATDSFRKGNVMLAGDAAHVHSPIGGQGMNLGMQDANNLLWKMAWSKRILGASHGEDDYAKAQEVVDAILETYHTERHFLGQELVKSVEMATTMLSVRNPVVKFFRNELIRMVLPSERAKKNFRKMGQLELSYQPPSSSLIFENGSWTESYICSPGQRLPNIQLEDGSKLFSHIDRVTHTWVFLNFGSGINRRNSNSSTTNNNESTEEGGGGAPPPQGAFVAAKTKVVHATPAAFEKQVAIPAISEKTYFARQVLLVRPDQFVAGVGPSMEALKDELKKAGMTSVALETM